MTPAELDVIVFGVLIAAGLKTGGRRRRRRFRLFPRVRHRRRRTFHRRRPVQRRWANAAEYYRSTQWHRQRLKCFQRDGWRCRACGYKNRRGRGLEGHHTNNDVYLHRLGRERRSDLMTLCRACHSDVSSLHHSYDSGFYDNIAGATSYYLNNRDTYLEWVRNQGAQPCA